MADSDEMTEMSRLDAWLWLFDRLDWPQFETAVGAAVAVPGKTVVTPWGIQLSVFQGDGGFWRFKVGTTSAKHDCSTGPVCRLLGCPFGQGRPAEDSAR